VLPHVAADMAAKDMCTAVRGGKLACMCTCVYLHVQYVCVCVCVQYVCVCVQYVCVCVCAHMRMCVFCGMKSALKGTQPCAPLPRSQVRVLARWCTQTGEEGTAGLAGGRGGAGRGFLTHLRARLLDARGSAELLQATEAEGNVPTLLGFLLGRGQDG